MKKLVLSAIALIGFISFSMAQATPAKKTATAAKPKMDVVSKESKVAAPAKVVPTAPAKPAAKPTIVATPAAVPLKKDGAPDKRFKANQTTSGPLKKDGTPDKRYNANKKN
jgi:hypothetical protein